MKTIFFAFILIWGGSLLAQNTRPVDDQQSDFMEKRLKMREEMHRRMMDKLLKGVGPDQDMFSDMESFLDEVMADSFNGQSSFSRTTAQNYKMEWSESSSGRTLTITPKNKDQALDLNVSNGIIEIKGKSENKTANGTTISQFTNRFNVPGDCDPSRVKMDQKDGKIFMHFPYLTVKAVESKPKDERKPLPPSETDVQI